MKTYKNLMEAKKQWSDIKDAKLKKQASQYLKALDKDQILCYSVEHDEFSIFDNEMEYLKAKKGKGKAMKWLKVEGKSIDGNLLNELFNFKGAVKHGFLDKADEKYVKDLKKKGWDIDEFNLTSKGYEITIQHKKGGRAKFIDKKSPSNVLKTASEKAV